jgi:hypothetical protein
MTASTVVHRCGGEVVLTCAAGFAALDAMEHLGRALDVPWSTYVIESCADAALISAAVERDFGLIVAGRPMYATGGWNSGEMLSLAKRFPCPVLSVPYSSVSTTTCAASSITNG